MVAVRLRLMRQVELNVQGSVQRLQHTAATTLMLCFSLEQPRDTRHDVGAVGCVVCCVLFVSTTPWITFMSLV